MSSLHYEMIRNLKGYNINEAFSYVTTRQATMSRNSVTIFRNVFSKIDSESIDIAKYLNDHKNLDINHEILQKVSDNVLEIVSDSTENENNRKTLLREKNVFLFRSENDNDDEFAQKVVEKLFEDVENESSSRYYARDSMVAPNNTSFLNVKSSTIHSDDAANIVEGVNTSMWYIGGPGSTTLLHVEDGDFASMNILLTGHDKIWGIIDKKDFPQLKQNVKSYLGNKKDCRIFHKPSYLIHHNLLKKWGISLQYLIQKAGDLVYVSEATMHFVVNTGLNMAEAINFGTPASTIKPDITFCNCKDSDIGRIRRQDFVFKPINNIKGSKKKTFPCNQNGCNKVFMYKRSYDEHVFEVHGVLPIPCRISECKKAFRSRQSESAHFKTNHCKSKVKSERKVKCSEAGCKKSFVITSNLIRHKKENHANSMREECDKCQQQISKRSLLAHLKRCIGKMECNNCQRLFFKKAKFRNTYKKMCK